MDPERFVDLLAKVLPRIESMLIALRLIVGCKAALNLAVLHVRKALLPRHRLKLEGDFTHLVGKEAQMDEVKAVHIAG